MTRTDSSPSQLPAQSKDARILATMRRHILDGRWGPGDRLPSNRALAEQFDVSLVTLQSALTHLRKEGAVVTHGRRGTFVADQPPHCSRYGIVLPPHALEPDATGMRSMYYSSLVNAMLRLQRDGARQVTIYHDVDGHTDVEDYRRLLADLAGHRLAGLLVLSVRALRDSPVFEQHEVPIVSIGSPTDAGPGLPPVVMPNQWPMFERALDLIAAEGRRHPLLVLSAGISERVLGDLTAAMQARGLSMPRRGAHGFHSQYPQWIEGWLDVMLRADMQPKPDSILIGDDHLVAPTVRALQTLGARVPDELFLVGHANMPYAPEQPLPIRRVGFDARQVIQTVIDVLDRQRRHEPVPPVIEVGPVIDEEVTPD